MPIAEAFEQHGEEAFRAREAEVVGALLEEADGGAIALGGGSVLSRADPRGARPPHRRLAAGRRRARPGAGSPTATARWRPAPRTSRGCWRRASRSTRSSPTRSCRSATAASSSGRCRRSRRWPSCRRGRSCSGRRAPRASTRSWSAEGLLGGGLVAAGAGARFCVTDATVGALYAERARPARGADRGRARRGVEDDGRGRAGAARAGRAPG